MREIVQVPSALAPEAPKTNFNMSNRRLDIQGLRAVAVLVVVGFHSGLPLPGGFVGVDIFFVVSGFVITTMLYREWSSTGRVNFRDFYLRRFKRLTPALALMVAIVMALSALVLSPLGPQQNAARTGFGSLLLVGNFVIARSTGGYFDAPAETNPLLNTWSLAIEEQFYIVFPALIVLGWGLARRKGLLRFSPLALVSTIGLLSFFLAEARPILPFFQGSEALTGFYSPLSRAWEFSLGALLSLAPRKSPRKSPRISSSLGWIGFALLIASFCLISKSTRFPGTWTILPVAGTLLLLTSGSSENSPTTKLLSFKPLVKIGDWSYSIYLWHWPIIVFARILWPGNRATLVAAAAVSLAPAIASFKFLEQPIRGLTVRSLRSAGLLVSIVFAVPTVAALGLNLTTTHFWLPRIDPFITKANEAHAVYTLGCHSGPSDGFSDQEPCVWEKSAEGPPIYLLGDSNAAHFVEGLITSSNELKRPLIATTSAGCPLLDISMRSPSTADFEKTCAARTSRILDWMEVQEHGTAIISQTDLYWLSSNYPIIGSGGSQIKDQESKIHLMQDALIRTVLRLQAAGHSVVLIQSVPHFFGEYLWNPASCSALETVNKCVEEMPLEVALRRSSGVRDAVLKAGEVTGASVVDFANELCPNYKCRTRNDLIPVYSDSEHITVAMSEKLSTMFVKLLSGLASPQCDGTYC